MRLHDLVSLKTLFSLATDSEICHYYIFYAFSFEMNTIRRIGKVYLIELTILLRVASLNIFTGLAILLQAYKAG